MRKWSDSHSCHLQGKKLNTEPFFENSILNIKENEKLERKKIVKSGNEIQYEKPKLRGKLS